MNVEPGTGGGGGASVTIQFPEDSSCVAESKAPGTPWRWRVLTRPVPQCDFDRGSGSFATELSLPRTLLPNFFAA